VSTSNSAIFEDVRIDVRLKISALWIAMLFLFAYGDIFGFFAPGQIEEVIGGEISGLEITQVFLFVVSLYIAIASAMIFLSLVLAPKVSRWTNVVLPILYVVSIVASAVGESAYFWFLSIAESALLLLIVRYAWTWPRQEASRVGSVRAGSAVAGARSQPWLAHGCGSPSRLRQCFKPIGGRYVTACETSDAIPVTTIMLALRIMTVIGRRASGRSLEGRKLLQILLTRRCADPVEEPLERLRGLPAVSPVDCMYRHQYSEDEAAGRATRRGFTCSVGSLQAWEQRRARGSFDRRART
jgi:Family of unknown function (DUF6326)